MAFGAGRLVQRVGVLEDRSELADFNQHGETLEVRPSPQRRRRRSSPSSLLSRPAGS
jgi:hypothetical protein